MFGFSQATTTLLGLVVYGVEVGWTRSISSHHTPTLNRVVRSYVSAHDNSAGPSVTIDRSTILNRLRRSDVLDSNFIDPRVVNDGEDQVNYLTRVDPTTSETVIDQLAAHRHRKHHRSAGTDQFNWFITNVFKKYSDAVQYLHKFGYLADSAFTKSAITEALRLFQKTSHLTEDGKLNSETLKEMHEDRCGNADFEFVPGTSGNLRSKRFVKIAKWPSKYNVEEKTLSLKYFVETYTDDISRDKIDEEVAKAFAIWSNQDSEVKVKLEKANSASESDINIVWTTGDHGDSFPFDNAGGARTNVLAHTFYPNYQETSGDNIAGDIHFDDAELWIPDSTLSVPGRKTTRFGYVLVHEIGHALGLGHSKAERSVMHRKYRNLNLAETALTDDDYCGIHWTYDGNSNDCLFIWIMNEVVPGLNRTTPPLGYNEHEIEEVIRNWKVGSMTVDQLADLKKEILITAQINGAMELLKETDLAACEDDGSVTRDDIVSMMQQDLGMTQSSAFEYSKAACLFIDGIKTNSNVTTTNTLRRTRELSSGRNSTKQTVNTIDYSIFDSEYYNSDFYRKLLKRFFQGR